MSQTGIDSLVFDLKSPVEDIRQAAIVELVKLNDIKAIPILKDIASRDESVRIRYYAKKGLQFLKKRTEVENKGSFDFGKASPDELLTRLDDAFVSGDVEDRIGVVQSIVRFERREMVSRLVQLLRNQADPFVKSKLIMAIGILGDSGCLAEIEPFLRDPDYRIRANSIEAIGSIGGMDACPVLIGCLEDSDNRVKANAIRELRKFGVELIASTLDSMCVSGDLWMRDSAASALVAIESERFLPNVIRLLQDDSESVRTKASQALNALAAKGVAMAGAIASKLVDARLDPDSAREFMGISRAPRPAKTFSGLDDRDFKTRLDTVYALIADNRTDSVDPLLKRLQVEDDRYVMAAIVSALGRLSKAERVRDTLLSHLSSEHSRVRANAVEALGNFRDEICTDRLVGMLGDGNNRVRGNAIIALKDRPGVDLVTPIADMVRSNNRFMQRSAVYVILELEDESAIPLLGELWELGDEKTRAKVLSATAILGDTGSQAAASLYGKLTSGGDFSGTFVSDMDEAEDTEDKPPNAEGSSQTAAVSVSNAAEPRQPKTATASVPALEILTSDGREGIEIDKLVFNLNAEDRQTKLEALKILAEIGDERCLDAVMGLISHSDESVRGTARETLAAVKKKIDFSKHLQSLTGSSGGGRLTSDNFMILINDSNRDIRLSAVMSVRFCDASFLPQLIFRLKVESDPYVVSALVSTIGLLDDGSYAQTLGKFTYHTDARVRANAVEGLAYTASKDAIPYILLAMGDPTSRVRTNVRRALKHFPSQEVFTAAEELVLSSGIDGTRAVIQAGISLGDDMGRNLVSIVLSRTGDEQIFLDMARLVSEVRDSDLSALLRQMSRGIDPPRAKLIETVAEICAGGSLRIDDAIEEFSSKKTASSLKRTQPVHSRPDAEESPDSAGDHILKIARKMSEGREAFSTGDGVDDSHTQTPSPTGKMELLLKELADEAASGDEEARKAAVLKIARITDPRARDVLSRIAEKDKSPVVRYFAKRFLKLGPQSPSTPHLPNVPFAGVAETPSSVRGSREQGHSGRDVSHDVRKPSSRRISLKMVSAACIAAALVGGFFYFEPQIDSLRAMLTGLIESYSGNSGKAGLDEGTGKVDPGRDSGSSRSASETESLSSAIDGVIAEVDGLESSEDVKAAVKWGDVFERSSKWAKARETYEKAFEANPQSLEIGLRLIRTMRKEGSDPSNAASMASGQIRVYLEALSRTNLSDRISQLSQDRLEGIPWPKLSLGLACVADSRWSQAIDALTVFLSRKPDYPDALLPLALALYKTGDARTAEKALKKVSEMRPYMPGPSLVMGLMSQARGDDSSAEREFGIAKGKGAGRPTVFISSALWAVESGKLNTAWEDSLAVLPFLSGWRMTAKTFSDTFSNLGDAVSSAKCLILSRLDRRSFDETDLDGFIKANPEDRAKVVFYESFRVDKSFSAFRKSLELEYFQ